jgi:hypothetical protein
LEILAKELSRVVVLGPIRSGKTLIGRAMNSHPLVSVQQEPFFFFFKLCRDIYHQDVLKDNYDCNHPIESDFCLKPEQKNGFNDYFERLEFGSEDIVELRKRTIWQQESTGSERAPHINPFLDSLKPGKATDVLDQLFDVFLKGYPKEGLEYIGFTEAWVDNFIEPILSLKGKRHKIIHCIRDPRQIIASRNFGKNPEKYGGKYPILFLIRHWRKSVAYSIVNRDNPDYMVVKYEQLINSPEEWFQKICEHLGVAFHENLVHPERYRDGIGNLWKQNTNFNAGTGFSKTSLEKWKEVLPDKSVGLIEYLCGAEMDYFGYKRVNSDFYLKDLASYTEDEEHIIEWLRRYNLLINEEDISLELVRKYLLETDELANDQILDYFFIGKSVHDILRERTRVRFREN